MKLNRNSRKKNVFLTSGMGLIYQLCSNLMAFVYRTVFLYVLSVDYLGINGLFSNIINIFSLAELGIGSVIVYRLYDPIKNADVSQMSALMRFYSQFYHLLAVIIAVVGIALTPFLPLFIHDLNEVPSDVNIYVVYLLFVLQSVTSYLFVYKQSLLNADQRGYIVSLAQSVWTVVRYLLQIVFLLITRDFTLTLAVGIVANVASNAVFSGIITGWYSEVFACKNKLRKDEKQSIFKDTFALLCHNIGQTVVFSTDNLILSTFVGTVAVGIYSNYSLIINAVSNVLKTILGTFTSSIGNFKLSADSKAVYELYKKLRFANMWIASFCACSLYLLLSPFISVVWNGEKILFSDSVVLALCISFFLSYARIVNGSFINACGLFVRDKIRPLIEAIVNLVVSIVLVEQIGIVGIFIGTIISNMVTVWWREPYILYHELFETSLTEYIKEYVKWCLLCVIAVLGIGRIFESLPMNMFFLIIRFVICGIVINVFFAAVMWRRESFQYYRKLLWEMLNNKILKRRR